MSKRTQKTELLYWVCNLAQVMGIFVQASIGTIGKTLFSAFFLAWGLWMIIEIRTGWYDERCNKTRRNDE